MEILFADEMKIYRGLDENGNLETVTQDSSGNWIQLRGSIGTGWILTDRKIALKSLVSPFDPYVFFGIGLNYRTYADSIGLKTTEFPLVFMKQGCTAIGPEEPIEIPRFLPADKVDYEAELGIVIGKACKNCTVETAMDYVAGYVCANDVSSRDWQFEKGCGQFSRGKTFDTFSPIGPCFVTADEIENPDNLKIQATVNGELRQESNTSDMIFSIQRIIAFLSGSTTLQPGTVILTGTPGGTGSGQNPPQFLKAGDSVTIEIEKIGKLTNPVIEEKVEE